MKKIANISQTYGSERIDEIKMWVRNTAQIWALKQVDGRFFMFHNCGERFIKKAKRILRATYSDMQFIVYNGINYRDTMFESLSLLKSLGYTDIFFCQDDHLLREKIPDVHSIIKDTFLFYYKEKDVKWLHLYGNEEKEFVEPLIHKGESIIYSKYDTSTFDPSKLWAYSDGPYLMNINFMKENLFIDSEKEKMPERVWELEHYLNQKAQNNHFERWANNKEMFRAMSLHGPNKNNKSKKEVISSFLLDEVQ